MKKAALILLSAGLSLCAQDGSTWVMAHGGGTRVGLHDSPYKVAPTGGFSTGVFFTDHLGAELMWLHARISPRKSGPDSDQDHFSLGGILNFRPHASWYPYLGIHAGVTHVDEPFSGSAGSTNCVSYGGSLGVRARFDENWTLGVEARGVRIHTPGSHTNEAMGLLGLGYTWGVRKAPKPAPAPAPEPPPAPAPAPVAPPPPPPPPPAPAPEPPPPPPAPEPEIQERPTPPPPPPAKIVLDEAVLHFANGKADLSPEGADAVRKVAEGLKAYRGAYTLTVSGFTSSSGPRAVNMALSKKRADAVAKVLVDAGVPAAAVKTVGRGPESPVADNKTPEGQARNRRVEIDVKVQGGNAEVRKRETGTVNAAAAPAKPKARRRRAPKKP